MDRRSLEKVGVKVAPKEKVVDHSKDLGFISEVDDETRLSKITPMLVP